MYSHIAAVLVKDFAKKMLPLGHFEIRESDNDVRWIAPNMSSAREGRYVSMSATFTGKDREALFKNVDALYELAANGVIRIWNFSRFHETDIFMDIPADEVRKMIYNNLHSFIYDDEEEDCFIKKTSAEAVTQKTTDTENTALTNPTDNNEETDNNVRRNWTLHSGNKKYRIVFESDESDDENAETHSSSEENVRQVAQSK